MAKKSLYIFLTAILGIVLFLVLDRIVVFCYLYLVAAGYIGASFDYGKFVVWDYFSLTIALMLGAWYGVWLGLNWFSLVYERQTHGGFINHVIENYWPNRKQKNLDVKISDVKKRLQTDMWQLEEIAQASVAQMSEPVPRVKKIVRKRAPKKMLQK